MDWCGTNGVLLAQAPGPSCVKGKKKLENGLWGFYGNLNYGIDIKHMLEGLQTLKHLASNSLFKSLN